MSSRAATSTTDEPRPLDTSQPPPGSGSPGRATVSIVVALAANVLVLAAGRSSGLDLRVGQGGQPPMEVGYVAVTVATVVPLLLGFGVAAVVRTRWEGGVRVLAWVGGALALASLVGPLGAEASPATGLLLSSMHLVAGVAYVVGLRPGGAR